MVSISMSQPAFNPNTPYQESVNNINLFNKQFMTRIERGMSHKNLLRRQTNDTRPQDSKGRRISGFPSAISPFDPRHSIGCNNQVQGIPHEEVDDTHMYISGIRQYEIQNMDKADTHPLIHDNGQHKIVDGVLTNKSYNNNSDKISSLESNTANQGNEYGGNE